MKDMDNQLPPWDDPEVIWMCEKHPNLEFEHDDCPGPGVPFKNGVEVKAPEV
jgi:hypothetical protein